MADDEEMEVDKEGPRFVVKKWNAVTFWSWDICTDTCAICRNKLYEPSIEAQANPGLADDAGYSIAWGCCGHVFHLDCISRWLKTRSVCPLCNREWEYAARPARPTRRALFHASTTRMQRSKARGKWKTILGCSPSLTHRPPVSRSRIFVQIREDREDCDVRLIGLSAFPPVRDGELTERAVDTWRGKRRTLECAAR